MHGLHLKEFSKNEYKKLLIISLVTQTFYKKWGGIGGC